MAVRVVILDLDDTLIVETAVARASLRSALRLLPRLDSDLSEEILLACARRAWRAGPCHRLCLQLGIASWEGLWATFEGGHPSLAELRAWAPSFRRETWSTVLSELDVADPELAADMAEAYIASQRAGRPLIEGATETVRALSRDYRLGLLTNGPADIQLLKIRQTGLADCFDTVVISGEAGVGKPSAEAFGQVLDALDGSPGEAVMVGDSWERDIQGALAVGIRPVWIAGDRPLPPGSSPVAAVSSIAAVSDAI